MISTDEGLPLFLIGGGDPDRLRAEVTAASAIAEPSQRAARLYFLGRGLFDCDDLTTADDAVAVLWEAAQLGSTHAAFDLATIVMHAADTIQDVGTAVRLLERAAAGGHVDGVMVLRELRRGTGVEDEP